MAREIEIFDRSRQASADLSASQYCAVLLNSSSQLALPSAGVDVYGVLQDKPKAAGRAGSVRILGLTKMVVGASTVTAGDKVMVDSAGKAVTATSTNFVIGISEDTGATGTTISVLLRPGGKI
jgi:Uncharacterized conserved protein (DUF2190)